MKLINGSVDVKSRIKLRVDLDELLVPERKTLLPVRSALGLHGAKSNPLLPPKEFFESFLPHPNIASPVSNVSTQKSHPANLPEESGWRNADGSYILEGEWIEALPEPGDTRPRSNVVLLYCHGGGFVFCSATFHRQLLARMTLEFGPGARAFVVDYRLAPEHPFPAAIHDMYAAYLYLTQPNHPAVRLVERQRHYTAALHHVPVDPANIVLAGDSAGAALITGFKLYIRDYVQPSLPYKLKMPSATVLISGWMDISTSMPAASEHHTHCYTPAMMGVSPVNRQEFDALSKQTGTFDRLRDDVRLMAHRLHQYNKGSSETRIRIEVYRDMLHVHQWFEFLPLAAHALKNIVAFVEDSQKRNWALQAAQPYHGSEPEETKGPSGKEGQQQHRHHQEHQIYHHTRKGSSSFVIKASSSSMTLTDTTEDMDCQKTTLLQTSSTRVQACMVTAATTRENTEWIIVELDGRETFSKEGTPIEVLEASWRGVQIC
ncbi:hypothetical protein BGW42_004773 [Actinomortierella wolfii]|nr:hypothetical protein BGW42_004773 [Actinomortierella wolfii]